MRLKFVFPFLLGSCVTAIDNPLLLDAGVVAGGTAGATGGGTASAGGAAAGGTTAGGAAGGSTAGGMAAGGMAAGGMAAGGMAAGGAAGGTAGGAACVESWACGPWSITNGMATRACLDSNACGTTTTRPALGPLAAPGLDLNFYKCNVHPVLQRSCASLGCHGTEQGRALKTYARGRLRNTEMITRSVCQPNITTPYDLSTCTASVDCDCKRPHTTAEWQKSFDSARSFFVQVSTPAQSELLTQPLAGTAFVHAGRKIFASTTDPRYVAISNWLSGMTLATCTTTPN